MDIMSGAYLMNNGDIKRITNIYPNYEPLFWIKVEQFQKLNIMLTTNYLRENPIDYIDFYEYYYYSINEKNFKNIKQTVIPERKSNKDLFISLSFLIENSETKYVLLIIKLKAFVEYLELKTDIQGNIYNLEIINQ